MEILLNGENYQLSKEIPLMELIEKLETEWSIQLENAVVLVNDEVVKKEKWSKVIIRDENQVEVLSFVSGG